MRVLLIVAVALAIVLVSFPLWRKFRGTDVDTGLSIAELRFVEYEGGPVPSQPYQPGDEVLLTFLLRSADLKNPAVTFHVKDPDGRPVSPASRLDLGGPRARAPAFYRFTLPLYALGGTHVVRVEAEDGRNKASGTVTFQVLGPQSPQAAQGAGLDTLGIREHAFTAVEGGAALVEASYRPGMKIRTRFHVVGFRLGDGNHVKLRVDLGIRSAEGESLLDRPGVVAIDQPLFYPAFYMPVAVSVGTPDDVPAGIYRMIYTLHDGVSGHALSVEEPFTIR